MTTYLLAEKSFDVTIWMLQAEHHYIRIEVRGNVTDKSQKFCPSDPALQSLMSPEGIVRHSGHRLISVIQFNNEADLLLARFLETFDDVVGEQNTAGLVIIAPGSDQ
jgi:hypothetical protein